MLSDSNDDGQSSRRVETEDDGRRTMKYTKNEETPTTEQKVLIR